MSLKMNISFNKIKLVKIVSVFISYFFLFQFSCVAEEPDSKSIPKPILMLGLYCNSAMSTLKGRFESNPSAPPWLAEGPRKDAILGLLQKLDFNDMGYAKAVKDKALTPAEAQFLKFSAVHEADQWLNNITKSCSSPSLTTEEYDLCLKETNSETYKCYRQIIDAAKIITNAKGIK
jgi:hypothetical protein